MNVLQISLMQDFKVQQYMYTVIGAVGIPIDRRVSAESQLMRA